MAPSESVIAGVVLAFATVPLMPFAVVTETEVTGATYPAKDEIVLQTKPPDPSEAQTCPEAVA
jgi:hypothetical protein